MSDYGEKSIFRMYIWCCQGSGDKQAENDLINIIRFVKMI